MNKTKTYNLISLTLNLTIVILEVVGFYAAFSNHGFGMMIYYTQQSNLLLLIAALIYSISKISVLKEPPKKLPYGITLFKYVSTCLVVVTFTIVFTILAAMAAPSGKKAVLNLFFGDANKYHHVLCPVLAMVSFFVFEHDIAPKNKERAIAVIPTFLYAVIYIVLNALRLIRGPYPFLLVLDNPIWLSIIFFVVIVGFAYLAAWVIGKLKCRGMAKI